MDVTKKYRFEMTFVPESSRRAHESWFEVNKVDWTKVIWKFNRVSAWSENIGLFETLNKGQEIATRLSYFLPCIEGPVNLEDYM